MTDLTQMPPPRVMTKTKLYAANSNDKNSTVALMNTAQRDLLDELLLVYFKSGQSWTGEDTIELYCHGRALLLV